MARGERKPLWCIVSLLLLPSCATSSPEFHRYVIVGAGPAGLQLAHYLASANRDYLVVDKAAGPGSFFVRFPRWRQLISINKVNTGRAEHDYSLRMDWNSLLSEPSTSSLSALGQDFSAAAVPCPGGEDHAPSILTCWAADYSSSDPRRTRQSVPAELSFRHFAREYYPHADRLVEYLRHWSDPAAPRGAVAGSATPPQPVALALRFNVTVSLVERLQPGEGDGPGPGARFLLRTAGGGVIACRYLVWAAGLQRLQHAEGLNVAAVAENYWTHSTNLSDYEDKAVLVLGRGNGAFELANHVLGVASLVHIVGRDSGRIRLATETHYPGDVRHVHSTLLETYLLKSGDGLAEGSHAKLHITFNNASGQYDVQDTSQRCEVDALGRQLQRCFFTRSYDKVISCPGWRFDASPFADSARPALARGGKYPALNPTYESVNVSGLYFAGTLGHVLDFRISSGGFIHGFRYAVRALHRLLEEEEQAEGASGASPGTLRNASARVWMPLAHNHSRVDDAAAAAVRDAVLLADGTGAAGVEVRGEPAADLIDARQGPRADRRRGATRSLAAISALSRAGGWPRRYTTGLRSLLSAILRRINVASGPYQMFSTVADMVVFPPLDAAAVSSLNFRGTGVSAPLADAASYYDATVADPAVPQVPPAPPRRGASRAEQRAQLRQLATERAVDAALVAAVLEEVPVGLAPWKACAWVAQTAAVVRAVASGPAAPLVSPTGWQWCEYALVTLEFGPQEVGGRKLSTTTSPHDSPPDPYSQLRANVTEWAPHLSRFLHPVVRLFRVWHDDTGVHQRRPQLLMEQQIVEDFHGLFLHHTSHILSLARFLEDVAARRLLAAVAPRAALNPTQLDAVAAAATAAAGAGATQAHRWWWVPGGVGGRLPSLAEDTAWAAAAAAPSLSGRPVIAASGGRRRSGSEAGDSNIWGSSDSFATRVKEAMKFPFATLYFRGVAVTGGSAWFHSLSINATQQLLSGDRVLLTHWRDVVPLPLSASEQAALEAVRAQISGDPTGGAAVAGQPAATLDLMDPAAYADGAEPGQQRRAPRRFPLSPAVWLSMEEPPLEREQAQQRDANAAFLHSWCTDASLAAPDAAIISVQARTGLARIRAENAGVTRIPSFVLSIPPPLPVAADAGPAVAVTAAGWQDSVLPGSGFEQASLALREAVARWGRGSG